MKKRSSRNRTLVCDPREIERLSRQIVCIEKNVTPDDLYEQVILGNIFSVSRFLPALFVDLVILDPPYNLSKNYNGNLFKEKEKAVYRAWFENIILKIKPVLKESATIYVCSDWKTSTVIASVLEKHFYIRNRISWERDKGRGAKANWKNNTEDIWFCTASENYYFDVEAVKIKRKVIAPYKIDGKPKDWNEEEKSKYRMTHPSNIWTDITIPFWSMPENTDHPTQKPEKLIAKLLLASSKPMDIVFDPFLGSGTTAVVAKKLGRRYFAVEINKEYCCYALKRLELAEQDKTIQGYADGVFWDRNSLSDQPRKPDKVMAKLELNL